MTPFLNLFQAWHAGSQPGRLNQEAAIALANAELPSQRWPDGGDPSTWSDAAAAHALLKWPGRRLVIVIDDEVKRIATLNLLRRRGTHAYHLDTEHDRSWTDDPTAHSILVGSAPAAGARLLFSSPSFSSRTAAVSAALIGHDASWIVPDGQLGRSLLAIQTLNPDPPAKLRVFLYGPEIPHMGNRLLPHHLRLLSANAEPRPDWRPFVLNQPEPKIEIVYRNLPEDASLWPAILRDFPPLEEEIQSVSLKAANSLAKEAKCIWNGGSPRLLRPKDPLVDGDLLFVCEAAQDSYAQAYLNQYGYEIIPVHPGLPGYGLEDAAAILAANGRMVVASEEWELESLSGSNSRLTHRSLQVPRREPDDLSAEGPLDLFRHLSDVAQLAGNFAQTLAPELKMDFISAGNIHDLGIAETRMQTLLHGSAARARFASPIAKGKTHRQIHQVDAAMTGYRHEIASVRVAEILIPGKVSKLAKHLVLSHHGHCRPYLPCQPQVAMQFRIADKMVELPPLDQIDFDLEQIRRHVALQEKFGIYGLAWLEAIFRLAEWQASASPSNPNPNPK